MYLIDENLPPVLVELFRKHGLDAKHINEYEAKRPIKDDGIRRYALRYPNTIIVTRDDDFVRSYFNRKVPEKIIFVHKIEKREEVLHAFNQYLNEIKNLFPEHELIELNPEGIKVHF